MVRLTLSDTPVASLLLDNLLVFFEIVRERIQLSLPEAPMAVDPCCGLLKRPRVSPASGSPTVRHPMDQSGGLQHIQVL